MLKGTVKNLTIEGTIDASAIAADCGALAQRSQGVILEGVTNKAQVTGYNTAYEEVYAQYTKRTASTGGLIGSAEKGATVTGCSNTGAINGAYVGGLIGSMGWDTASEYVFTGCTNSGEITDVNIISAEIVNTSGEDLGTGGMSARN